MPEYTRILGTDKSASLVLPLLLYEAPNRVVSDEPDPRRKLAGYAAIGRLLMERLGPLLGVLLEGAGAGDPELRELLATLER